MKNMYRLIILSLFTLTNIELLAHDIEIVNADGTTIYYLWNPSNPDELTVTYQGDSYDYNSTNLSYSGHVTIPESVVYNNKEYRVTSIGEYTFANSTLTSISIPNSITTIGSGAFQITPWYSSQPNGVVYVGKVAYGYKGQMPNNTDIVLEDGTLGIAENAFAGCSGLTSIVMPEGITTIGRSAFNGCSSLTFVDIPNSVINIGRSAFDETAWFNNQQDGLIYAGNFAYKYKGTMPENTNLVLEDGTLGIAENAFADCSGLTSVTIPSSVKCIGANAFLSCLSLSNIEIPDNVESIGTSAFWACQNLTEVNIGNGLISISNGLFYSCKKLRTISIGNKVKCIGKEAFYDCYELTSLSLPNSVTSIDEKAFMGCHLSSIVFSEKLKTIGNSAFEGCWNLSFLKLPNSLEAIGDYAFSGIGNASIIILGNSVTTIGKGAFEWCHNLTDFYCFGAQAPTTEPDAFRHSIYTGYSEEELFGKIENVTLHVPASSIDLYKEAVPWKYFKDIVALEDETIQMNENGYSTYCSYFATDFTNIPNLKAYIASGINPSTGEVLLTRVYKVPAGEGILLKGDAGDYELPITDTNAYYTNLLKGVTRATTISPTEGNYTNFILANGSHGIGFYTLSQAGEIAAGKAYLQLPTPAISNGARGIKMRFDDEDSNPTAVSEVENQQPSESEYYDLQGRKVRSGAKMKGMYIMRNANGGNQGKKVFFRR